MHISKRHALCVMLAVSPAVIVGQGAGPDWPQFRGPNRDGAVASFVEPKVWPEWKPFTRGDFALSYDPNATQEAETETETETETTGTTPAPSRVDSGGDGQCRNC